MVARRRPEARRGHGRYKSAYYFINSIIYFESISFELFKFRIFTNNCHIASNTLPYQHSNQKDHYVYLLTSLSMYLLLPKSDQSIGNPFSLLPISNPHWPNHPDQAF